MLGDVLSKLDVITSGMQSLEKRVVATEERLKELVVASSGTAAGNI